MQNCPCKSRTSPSFTGEGTQTISARDEREKEGRREGKDKEMKKRRVRVEGKRGDRREE